MATPYKKPVAHVLGVCTILLATACMTGVSAIPTLAPAPSATTATHFASASVTSTFTPAPYTTVTMTPTFTSGPSATYTKLKTSIPTWTYSLDLVYRGSAASYIPDIATDLPPQN
jgi:hypothetical protein